MSCKLQRTVQHTVVRTLAAHKTPPAPVHLTRSTVGVVCVALGRRVHRIGGSHHVKLSLLEAVQHTTLHIVSHARAWKLVCLSIC